MPLTPDDVQNKRFTVVRFGKSGYDEEEVDSFLDEIEAEMRRLLAEANSLRAAVAATPETPSEPTPTTPVAAVPAEEPSETALRTLLLAQRTADEAIAQAQAEAEQIVAQAAQRAADLERDGSAELAQRRAVVDAAIAALRNFEHDYRTRLRAYLEGELTDLEALGDLAPPMPQVDPPPGGSSEPAPPSPPGLPQTGGATPAGPPVEAAPSETEPAPPGLPQTGGATPAGPPVEAAPSETEPAPPGLPQTGGATPVGHPTLVPPVAPFGDAPPVAPVPTARPFVPAVVPEIETDVDAGSDMPSGPPAQADNSSEDARD